MVISVLVVGIGLRFAYVDRKIYWRDETATSSRVSGYMRADVLQQVYDGRVIRAADLAKYQQVNPEKGWLDTVRSLVIEDPQHPPLYFLIARFWTQEFGPSVQSIRMLSALLSLLVFPALYWLCLELFGSAQVSWLTMALVAVSLVHVTYAQEARQFSLWSVLIVLSSAVFLRAVRNSTRRAWGAYAAIVIVGLYTTPLTGLVIITHGLYGAVIERQRTAKFIIPYLLAVTLALLVFAPWLTVMAQQWSMMQQEVNWSAMRMSYLELSQQWLANLNRAFVEPRFSLLPIAALVGYASYFLGRYAPARVSGFVLALVGVSAIAFVVPDLLLGGHRSTAVRYMLPCYLGLQLAVAYLLATLVTANLRWQRRVGQVLAVIILSVGVVTCTQYVHSEFAWNKGDNELLPMSRIINQASHPLVISDIRVTGRMEDGMVGSVLALSTRLNPATRLQLVAEPMLPVVPEDAKSLFVFSRYPGLALRLSQALHRKAMLLHTQKTALWQLEPVSSSESVSSQTSES